jgi:hypothetical protein
MVGDDASVARPDRPAREEGDGYRLEASLIETLPPLTDTKSIPPIRISIYMADTPISIQSNDMAFLWLPA